MTRDADYWNRPETAEDWLLAGERRRLKALHQSKAFMAQSQLPSKPLKAMANKQGQTDDERTSGASVPAVLVDAYRSAQYEIDWLALDITGTLQTVSLPLDEPNEALKAIFNMTGLATSAFISAYNPLGLPFPQGENEERHAELLDAVEALNLRHLSGRGRDPNGNWPAEESLLVIGLTRETARDLGIRFQQNAILFADEDFVPRLVLLR